MKTANAGLISLLNSGQFVMADLLTLTTVGGTVYRYTSADKNIPYDGNTFSANGVRFKRGRTRLVVGVEVDELDLTFYAKSDDLLDGVPFLHAVHNRALDGAEVLLERGFAPTWNDPVTGTLIMFGGRCGPFELGRAGGARVKVKSDLTLLNIKIPRNMYQPSCLHTLYDTGCGLTKASFAAATTAASGSTKQTLNCGLAQAAGWFDQGTITFTSGANSGVSRNVKSYTPGVVTLSYPLPSLPSIGDGFTAYPGCDKKQATCSSKFSNLTNFRGFPYVPVPETVL